MRGSRLIKSFLIALLLLAFSGVSYAQTDVKAIVKKSDDLMRGLQSYAKIKMVVTRPAYERSMVMESWTEGTEKAFIRTLAPAKEKGVTFLKVGREAWNYVPAIERVIKIPPSMMLQSWMGSDFTNDDLVKADSLIVDYTHKLDSEPELDGVKHWKITMIPKEDAAVVWGKVVMFVRQDNWVATRCDYHNEDMELVKYFVTADIQTIEGKQVPMQFSMINHKKAGHKTTIFYEDLTFKPKIGPKTFSKSNLKRQGG
jgi:outer membrane lipoprotein-sorting protein